jgi:hypothetical protein
MNCELNSWQIENSFQRTADRANTKSEIRNFLREFHEANAQHEIRNFLRYQQQLPRSFPSFQILMRLLSVF